MISYCGVGGYASTMYFVLSEVLNYTNVKVYDGSAQEWTSDMNLPVVHESLGFEYIELYDNYTELQEYYNQLQNDFDALQDAYDQLQDDYNELLNKCEKLTKTTTPAYLTYTFIATTMIFLLISIYLGIKVRGKNLNPI